MAPSTTLNLIKNSFETWYNRNVAKDSPVSVVINYSDMQVLSIKAYHTVTINVNIVGIQKCMSYTKSLIKIQENYNHGVTSEEEAKENLTMKLLEHLYSYQA